MAEFILHTIFWTLCLYGLFEIIKSVIMMFTYTKFKSDGIYLIVAVKNQEEKIEGFLRSFLFRIMYGKERDIKKIIVADLNSNDGTEKILEKMSEDNSMIHISKWKNCREIMDSINSAESDKIEDGKILKQKEKMI